MIAIIIAFYSCTDRFFRIYFAGYTSREVVNGASAAEFQAALASIRQDRSSGDGGGERVLANVERASKDSGAVEWRVTFLSHLEVGRGRGISPDESATTCLAPKSGRKLETGSPSRHARALTDPSPSIFVVCYDS